MVTIEKPNILIINDGNRRWAKQRGLSIKDGYREGEYLSTPNFSKNKIKIELHGNLDLIPEHFKRSYKSLVENTSLNTDFTLHYMINWSINDEIVRIYNRLHESHKAINEKILKENSDIKDPIDLIIRTGSRKRLSSCIPISSSFAEICFLDILFPEISGGNVDAALEFYHNQIRTYGKLTIKISCYVDC